MQTKARFLWLCVAVSGILTLAACGGGGGGSMTPSATVTISPKRAAVVITSQTQQFQATVTGNVSDMSVTWSVDGTAGGSAAAGTISSSGLYTPPGAGGTHTVTATSVAVSSASDSASVAVTDLAGVYTYHNDLARDGANTQEYALTPSLTTSTFGKLFSCAVDGAVYAQPLWVPSLNIGGGTHNVIFVATQHDSVYAFDSDANPCVTYWQAKLLDTLHGGTAGETPVVWNDVGNIGAGCYGDIYPEVGVTGTPVIDPASNTIYVVSASEIPSGPNTGNCSLPGLPFQHRLHALDLFSGSEKFNAPVAIAASVAGTGQGSSGGMVSFNSQLHHNRSGLALSNGVVYVAFAAHEDQTPYHGWLIGYNAGDLSQLPSIFNTTPNGGLGGIWGGGGAPAVDAGGDVYVATGNGIFDANSAVAPMNDYGDSILRLRPTTTGPFPNGVNLSLYGWFTPFDQSTLSAYDTDLGSGASVLFPDQPNPPTHLLVQVGKDGDVHLIDRDSMGQFNPTNNNQILQNFSGPVNGLWGTPALWNNNLYIGGASDSVRQFVFDPNTELFNPPSASSQTALAFGYTGDTPSVSSQGTMNGIVWVIDSSLYGYASPNAGGVNCSQSPPPAACSGPAILHAYNATNLGAELWNSSQAASNRDQAGNAVKMIVPTIANGKVYVGTRTEIDVYGLLPN